MDVPPEDDTFAQRCATPAPAAPATRVRVGDTEFARPADLAAAVALLAERPDATVIAGCTDWGVEVNLRGTRAPFVVAVDRLPELRTFSVGPSEVELGAALTLSEAERLLEGRIPLLDQLWPQFASRLIRNGATLGGNLGTASPIGDAPPALLALEAKLVLSGPDGDREVALADYFTGYRQTVKQKGELIRAVRIPMPPAPMAAFHKIAKRRFDDISSVAIAFALDVVDGVVAARHHRPRWGGGNAAAGHRHRRRAARPPMDRRHRAGGRRACSVTRAPRSTTTGPALPSAPRCSSSRCSNSMPNPQCQRGPHHE